MIVQSLDGRGTTHEKAFAFSRWQEALESAGQGLWDVNHVTGDSFYSSAWYKMRGLDTSDTEAADYDVWLKRVHPDDRDMILEMFKNEEAGLVDSVCYEYRERHTAGHYIWIMCRGHVLSRGDDGRSTRSIGIDADITALKAAQEKLVVMAENERRSRVAIESAGVGVWDIDGLTGKRHFSPAWYDIRGLDADKHEPLSHEEWRAVVHPEDRDRIHLEFEARKTNGSDEILHKYRQRNADGSWIWILSRGKILERLSDGTPTRMIGIDTDITDLMESESDYNNLATTFRIAAAIARVGVWQCDIATGDLILDASCRRVLGLDANRERYSGREVPACVHPEDNGRRAAAFNAAIDNKSTYTCEYRFIRPDGEIRHIRSHAAYTEDAVKGPRLIGVHLDVTHEHLKNLELQVAKDIAERQNQDLTEARNREKHIALHDALTGLANRRSLDTRLANLHTECANGRFALLHLDLDRFKHINDTFGHPAGDEILKIASAILSDYQSDCVKAYRVGGDEFVVFITEAPSVDELCGLAATLVARMNQPVMVQEHECIYGVSIGVATSEGGDVDGKQLLVNADIALYRAKNNGRNHYALFSEEMKVTIAEHKRCADDIIRGLDRGEFVAHYQLQVDGRTLEVQGAEALVRWNHPEKGLLTPDKFLPVAEEINAVARIDELIFKNAVADLAIWRRNGIAIPHVSVNVSARRLRDEKLIERVKHVNFEPGTVSFELLESIFLDNQSEVVASNLKQLRDMGIAIDLDDFGTGHASIAGLLSLRPNRLKIDRNLIKPIVVSIEQRRLVAAILEMGRAMGIQIVAEGVESLEHARILQKMDCCYLQGFAFAQPMSASDLVSHVQRAAWLKAA
jgi:diguanylate cyclase (GGDEF)-like protein/PAS domain S-box-containing protein